MRRKKLTCLTCALLLAGCSSDDGDPVDDPDAPACAPAFEEVTFFQTSGTNASLAVSGAIAYVSDSFGLRVIDLSRPESPIEVTYFELATPILYFNDLVLDGDVAHVAGGIQGLITVDVSDPGAPTYLNTAFDGMPNGQHDALAVALSGEQAVTAESVRGLRVYDVSDPSAPVEIAIGDFHMDATTAIAASSDLVVVDDGPQLVLVDISDPTAPSVSATHAGLDETPRAFHIEGDHLFFGNGSNLEVLDVSNPALPSVVSSTPLEDSISAFYLHDECLYVGHTNGAFTAVDVKRVDAPIASEHVPTFGVLDTTGIVLSGEHVIVTSKDQGLRAYVEAEPSSGM